MSTLPDALAKAKATRRKLAAGVTELTDFVICEVSFVDLAANRRTWVLQKRAADANAATFTALYKAALGASPPPSTTLAKSLNEARASSALLKYADELRPSERLVLSALSKGLL
jgi:hypothetical protein